MTPYEAYCLFLAIKMHFTNAQYDFFKYHGKVKSNIDSFHKRRDKYHFAKLAKHKDPTGYLVAQYVSGNFTGWIGDLFSEEAEKTYVQYLARQQSISYNFNVELSRLSEDFVSLFKVRDGQHPPLLTIFKQGYISIETLTILNNHLSFFSAWDKKINDTVLWPSIRDRCLKYRPFLHYDKVKIKCMLHDHLESVGI